MDIAAGFSTFRSGFTRTFWVANIIELFERFAYYGSKAVLSVYLAQHIGLGPQVANVLAGSVFNTLLYLLPLLAGTVVDRFGFKRSLMACFSIFCVGYFLIGLAGMPAGKPIVDAIGPKTYMLIALVITAMGGSLIKPSVVGTVARTTTDSTKSLGYSIYYMLVNIGGAVGPFLAVPVRQNIGIAYVLVMSSVTSLLLLLATLAFYKEPPRPAGTPPATSMAKVLENMMMVFGNFKFISFLVIFSGFWIMFWQIFYALPFYVSDVLKFDRFEIIETVDAWTIILLTVAATALAKALKPITAMVLGFALASSSWFLMVYTPPAWAQVLAWPVVSVMNLVLWLLGAIGLPVTTIELTPVIAPAAFGLMVFAIGEGIQAPRYYEYVADLAPKDQVGTYMGFAFLPVAIGTFIAGGLGGKLVAYYIQGPGSSAPQNMWLVVGAVGIVSTALMLVYNRFIAPRKK
ncbi:MAG: MFS transporter [Acidobacteria bacterium]|nr:MFS transporter [Acidobacteriota bacterium]